MTTGKTIRNLTLIALILSVLAIFACAPAQTPAPATTAPTAQPTIQQAAWEQDWNKTLAEARKEGTVSIYSPAAADLRQQVSKAFKDKYGIEIEWTSLKSQEVPTKIMQERRAGLYLVDLVNGAISVQMTNLKPAGVFDPIKPLLILPEVLDAKAWFGGQLPWVDNDKAFTLNPLLAPSLRIAVNTDLVKPEELKSYNDLLAPRFKNNIILSNPLLYPRAFSETLTIMGPDFWKKLAANGLNIVDDEGLGAQWLAHGKYPIYIVNRTDVIAEMVSAGAPLKKIVPQEGVMLAGGAMATSLLKNAPHPNAAKIFMNWYLTKDANTVLARLNAMQSARLDVPTDFLAQDGLRQAGAKYVNAETEDFQLQQAAAATLAKEIFGSMVGR